MRLLALNSADRPWRHAALLGLTLVSTYWTYFHGAFGSVGAPVSDGIAFTLALVAILGSHEMGHYLLARYHRVDATLPFFIPAPLMGPGTLGAVIRIRERIPNRNALVDIGAAGPLAGLAVAIPVLFAGYLRANVVDTPLLPSSYPESWSLIGVIKLGWSYFHSSGADAVPAHVFTVFGDNLLTLAIQRLCVGPLTETQTVLAGPLIMAGWFGLLVTMLNLIPIGQLDGGHLTYALFGEKARYIGMAMSVGLVYLTLFHSVSWLLWLVITAFVIRYRHPAVVVEEVPLSRSRRVICYLCFAFFVLCVMPLPIRMVTVP
ncbi:MAG: site-2 protease family protein [Myxococcaceae bacterium]